MNMEELLPAAPEKIETVTAKPAKKIGNSDKFLADHWGKVELKKTDLDICLGVDLAKPEKPEPVKVNISPAKSMMIDLEQNEPTSETANLLNAPLYAMVDDYTALVDYLVERDGVMDEDSIAAWDSIQGTVKEKLENCGKVLRELKAKGANLRDESARMATRANAIKNSENRLKEYAKAQMIRMDMRKCEGVVLNLTVANTAPKCEVYDVAQVPDEFCMVGVRFTAEAWAKIKPAIEAILNHGDFPTDRTVNKKAVTDAWKANAGAVQVPGTIVEKGTSLTIR